MLEVIGLTGGIACGKSTVSALLRSRGVPVIDADVISRQVVETGTTALSQIVAAFGPNILQSDGTLDRPKLGAVIFNDELKRRRLNAIIHPAVRRRMLLEVVQCWLRGERLCVVDVPLLIEVGLYKWVGRVIVVACPEELQLQRLMRRDKLDKDAASSRMASQMPIGEKTKYADLLIDNSTSEDDLKQQIDSTLCRLNEDVRWTWRVSWLLPPVGIAMAAWTIFRRTLRRTLMQPHGKQT